jgi:DNA primase
VSSIALLGTKLDDSTALEISKAYRKVVFCLDNDATVKAVELSRKYNLLFDKVSILVPPADPKDMALEELENLLYAGG